MKILTNKHLFERELGNYLFSVPALLEWAKAKGHFLSTEPQIDGYDLAQVESVLCAIESAAAPNLDDAVDMVAATPRLAGHRAADNAHLSRWLVGAEAHRLWREEFTRAIDDGELKLFDAISRMPVRWPPASSGTTEKAAPEASRESPEQTDTTTSGAPEVKPAERRAAHDMTKERGCRRMIRENWDTVEKEFSPKADGIQVLRVLKRNSVPGEKLPTLKTVRNLLIELRKEKLIPG